MEKLVWSATNKVLTVASLGSGLGRVGWRQRVGDAAGVPDGSAREIGGVHLGSVVVAFAGGAGASVGHIQQCCEDRDRDGDE